MDGAMLMVLQGGGPSCSSLSDLGPCWAGGTHVVVHAVLGGFGLGQASSSDFPLSRLSLIDLGPYLA